MASAYAFMPAEHDGTQETFTATTAYQNSVAAFDANHLSPPPHHSSRSTSPSLHNAPTPEDFSSGLSFYSNNVSEGEDDRFFGVDFNALDTATPLFLDGFGQNAGFNLDISFVKTNSSSLGNHANNINNNNNNNSSSSSSSLNTDNFNTNILNANDINTTNLDTNNSNTNNFNFSGSTDPPPFAGRTQYLQTLAAEPDACPMTPAHSIIDVSPMTPKRGISRSATAPVSATTPVAASAHDFSQMNLYASSPYQLGVGPQQAQQYTYQEQQQHHLQHHHHQQLTPSRSCRSSEDAPVPALIVPHQSPYVTVSVWGKDGDVPAFQTAESQSFGGPALTPVTPVSQLAGDMADGINLQKKPRRAYTFTTSRNAAGNWNRNPSTGHGSSGVEPGRRTSEEIPSINEIVTRRQIEERNQEVGKWLTAAMTNSPPPMQAELAYNAKQDPDAEDDGIPLGDMTENRELPDQPYYQPSIGGEMTQEDIDIINSGRNWGNAPMIHAISRQGTLQPETSNAAIARFERLCQDNESIVSKAATWGTRRRSLPSIDVEGITSGNFLRKLTLNSRESRRPSILKDLRGLVRKPSTSGLLKRRGTMNGPHDYDGASELEKPTGMPLLAPPSRTSSWGKKATPNINTALISMATGVASIGAMHVRSGSINNPIGGSVSVNSSTLSPKSPFPSLSVNRSIRRQRSKSDVPPAPPLSRSASKSGGGGGLSNLAEMWKKSGGPPVASLANTSGIQADDDDDDDDDDLYDVADMRTESSKLIEDIAPTFSGFQQHVLRLNPGLAHVNNYLVDRIAHQQVVRYKSLLTARVKHLQQGSRCPCGTLCLALGGMAKPLNEKGELRVVDTVAAAAAVVIGMPGTGEDGDSLPLDGVVTQDSFPQDIPMPPTQTLPAEFECQLCFQPKKFQKPSDWTKHVHEDVQPFTCTWDKCREPKMFKRKADWVRHENEGHRHLEWWTCDVDECRHTCYRRDNFLQHLVREHRFAEPKIKTKAAIKRAGGLDPTWARVEQCHVETSHKPQDEPCRFCGRTFPSWKKLTVHLAKHMEHISLPMLKLVAAKELSADTIISPVQDPPARQLLSAGWDAPILQYATRSGLAQPVVPSQTSYTGGHSPYLFPVGHSQQQQQQQYYSYDGMNQNLDIDMPMLSAVSMPGHHQLPSPHALPSQTMPTLGQPFGQQQQQQQQQQQILPVTTAPYANVGIAVTGVMEPFPTLDAMAMTDPLPAYDVMDRIGRSAYGRQQQEGQSRGVSPYSVGRLSRSPSFYGQK